MWASRNDHRDAVNVLIELEVDLDVQDEVSATLIWTLTIFSTF